MLRTAIALCLAAACVGTAGCDLLFQLNELPTGDAAADAIDCPAGYMRMSSGYYRLHTARLMWIDARLRCKADGASTHLAVISSESERALVTSLTNDTVWIGLTDRVVEGSWIWITTEPDPAYPPLQVPPWAPSEPSMANGENCAVLEFGHFRDRVCDAAAEINVPVCECDGYVEDPTRF